MRLLSALSAVPLVAAAGPVALHRLGGGAGEDCSQCTVDQEHVELLEQKLGMTRGECAPAGFTEPIGSAASVNVPSVGPVELQAYSKRRATEQAAMATMCKVSRRRDECGQFALDSRFKAVAEEWLRMKEGFCSDLGYTEPVGSRSTELPLVDGRVNVTLFKRDDPLAELKKAGKGVLGQAISQAMGMPASRLPACCESCEPGTSKYCDVDAGKRECAELCLTPEAALMAQFFMNNLTAAGDSASCAGLGYGIYNKTLSKGLGVNADMYEWGAPPPPTPADWTTVRRPAGVECLQATVQRRHAEVALAVAGFEEGRCLDAGFSEEQDTQVPGFLTGEAKLTLFKKSGELSLVDTFRFTKDIFEEEEEGEQGSQQMVQPSLADLLV